MSQAAMIREVPARGPQLDNKPHAAGAIGFLVVLAAGLLYAA